MVTVVAALLAAALVAAGSSSGNSAPAPAASVPPGIPGIFDKVSPSVVTIVTDSGLGSGVVWSNNGTIVTADHVVAGSSRVQIELANGKLLDGTVRAEDPITDLAVVTAASTALRAATFAKTLPEVGELAIAIGSPLGFANTASVGIVSALQRALPGDPGQSPTLLNLLQTDAGISPGDSGGALVDSRGQVIGINEAYIPPSDGAVLIGFATPATTVDTIVRQLLDHGRATHAYFGAQLGDPSSDGAQPGSVGVDEGMVVLAVAPGGPAANAGLQPGDVIETLGATPVPSTVSFVTALRSRKPGTAVRVTFVRGTTELTTTVTLIEQPV
ncbi:MAG TPA: trypsin-like peptidase domain-containing protein [Acidimicrobiia bacterium]